MVIHGTRSLLSALFAATLVTLCIATAKAGEPMVRRAAVPDGGIHPQALTDSKGHVHLIYFKGEPRHGDIFYARSDDGGVSFTQPLRVNSQPDSAVIIG